MREREKSLWKRQTAGGQAHREIEKEKWGAENRRSSFYLSLSCSTEPQLAQNGRVRSTMVKNDRAKREKGMRRASATDYCDDE